MFFVSIGVDMGRVRVSKNQLQTATDAAAFAGAMALPSADHTDATDRAVTVAGENFVDGTAVALQPANDIQFGLYRQTTHVYTPVGSAEPGPHGHVVIDSDANAIKVTALRTRARGNPINLTFARAVGGSTFNVWTTATAFVRGGPSAFGIVGLDWVHIQGTSNTDSYDPTHGAYGGSNVHNGGTVASNGTITVNGTSSVHGDARPGVNSIVDINGSPTITGWTAPLDAPLVYPPTVYAAPGTNNNALVVPQTSINLSKQEFNPGNGTTTFATTTGGAKYVFKSWKMSSSGVNVVINGPATVWISGDFNMTGGNLKIVGNDTTARVIFYVNGDFKQTGGSISNPYPQRPGALTISMTGHNTTFSASAQLNAHIYAPTSDVTLHGNANNPPADFSGWLVGQTLTLTGNTQIHYDESLGGENTPHRAILVK
jgi:hypothetical protein